LTLSSLRAAVAATLAFTSAGAAITGAAVTETIAAKLKARIDRPSCLHDRLIVTLHCAPVGEFGDRLAAFRARPRIAASSYSLWGRVLAARSFPAGHGAVAGQRRRPVSSEPNGDEDITP
jgi:hypothetical protein